MKQLLRHRQFLKDFAKAKLTDTQFAKLVRYLSLLADGKPLPPEARDHALAGEYADTREFHLGGDMLVIYLDGDEAITLLRIGTHAQLFK